MTDQVTHIPWEELDPSTLDNLLSEIVTRDGTDYGLVEKTTRQKIAAALKSLQNRSSLLYWDDETGSAALVTVDQVREERARYESLARDCGLESIDATE